VGAAHGNRPWRSEFGAAGAAVLIIQPLGCWLGEGSGESGMFYFYESTGKEAETRQSEVKWLKGKGLEDGFAV